ncbi:Rad52 22 double-strand break repair protein [Mycena metata]|uniref:Rad52 22 double-strand break repair protein n=1 Tax=Mycena metata TaxID=1033252 RepID=A0AAD7NAY0_9AGAR|nr:Rad52 22 double-strand break repair protein [Mycena metata]
MLSNSTYERINLLQTKLDQHLGPEFVLQRPTPSGAGKISYAEGWRIINIANDVFGFQGWSSSIISLRVDNIDYNNETKLYIIGSSAIIRITLPDGVFHEDIGYAFVENGSKGTALEQSKKEAVTDGIKRALRTFGNALGNCLYNNVYTEEVVKMKVPLVRV